MALPNNTDLMTKSAICGATGYGMMHALQPNATAQIWGRQMSLASLSGIASAGGSVCADAAHAWILPHLPYHEKYGSTEGIAVAAGTGGLSHLAILSAMSGAYYYLYNEVAFLALGRVNPVTHAVGNTIKRVVIIIASVIAFKTPISGLGIIGSSIAIFGTLLYSLSKSKFG